MPRKNDAADLVPKALAAKMAEWRAAARPWTPHDYQGRAMRFMLENPQSGLLLPPGMGKTSTALGAFKVLSKKRLARRLLVVAPVRTVVAVEGGAAELDCTPSNGVKVTAANATLWEKVDDAS